MDSGGLVHLDRPELADDQRTGFAVDPRWFVGAPAELLRSWQIRWRSPGSFGRRCSWEPRAAVGHLLRAGLVLRSGPGTPRITDHPPALQPRASAPRRARVMSWNGRAGRALVATGSPSADVRLAGATAGQSGRGTTSSSFPVIGPGAAIVAEGQRAEPDDAFLGRRARPGFLVSEQRLRSGAIYPPISELQTGRSKRRRHGRAGTFATPGMGVSIVTTRSSRRSIGPCGGRSTSRTCLADLRGPMRLRTHLPPGTRARTPRRWPRSVRDGARQRHR